MISEQLKQNEYKTDKFPPDGHNYLETYDKLLGPRQLSARKVLEIGVDQGGSVQLWRDYFRNAQVYGIDVKDKPNGIDGVTYIKADAYSLVTLEQFRDLDVIIDDGPHTLHSMIFTAYYYASVLANNGILIIEDVQHIEWIEQLKRYAPKGYGLDLRGKNDDILFVIDRTI